MLSYALAIAVGISSLVLFFTAFVLSDLHRQDDFLWSGVGLFYALVLWYCAANITGAVLLGQAAASALIVSFSWQNLQLRKAIARPETAASPLSSKFSWLGSLSRLWQGKKATPDSAADKTSTASSKPAVDLPKVTEQEITIPEANSPVTPATTSSSPTTTATDSSVTTETVTEEKAAAKPTTEGKTTKVVNAPDTEPPTEPEAEPQTNSTEEPQPETKASELTEAPESPTTAESTEETPEEIPEPQTSSEMAEEPKSEIQDSSTASTPTTDTATPKNQAAESVLDSLETVEVAEVLEAVPEDPGSNQDSDRSNIIDVTTTEVDSVAPVNNTDSSTADSHNSNHEQQ